MISPEGSFSAPQEPIPVPEAVEVHPDAFRDDAEVLADFQAGLDAMPADLEKAEDLLAQAQELQPGINVLNQKLSSAELTEAQRAAFERELAVQLEQQAALMEQALQLQGNNL